MFLQHMQRVTNLVSLHLTRIMMMKNIANPLDTPLHAKSPLVCRKEAANYLGVKPQTLANWFSSQRYTLPVVKVGRKVMYQQSDLNAFIASNTHGSHLGANHAQ